MTNRNRRPTQWYESIQQDVALNAGQQAHTDLLSNIATGNRQGSTVTRMILDIQMRPGAITVTHEIYVGIAVLNADAVGASAFPDADSVDDTDWLFHARLISNSSNVSDGTQGDRIRMDIRSQRVLRAQQDRLILVRDNLIGAVTTYNHFIRVLMKHP